MAFGAANSAVRAMKRKRRGCVVESSHVRHGTRHSRVSTALIALPDAGPGDSQRTLVSRIYTGPAEAGTGLPGVYGTRRTSWRRALR